MWFVLWGAANATAGDVWMTVRDDDDTTRFTLDLPTSMTGAEDTVRIDGQTRPLAELVREVAAAPEGTARSWDVSDAAEPGTATLTLTHRSQLAAPAVTQVLVRISGPKGNGLTLSFPLDGGGVQRATQDTDLVRVEGLSLDLDRDEGVAAIRRQGPRTLVSAVGPQGNGLVITTQ